MYGKYTTSSTMLYCFNTLYQHTMNASEAPHNDSHTPEMTGFQSSMLTAATLSIVRVPHHHPLHPPGLRESGRKERITC